jgi:thioredoxin-like negative regulator of GroEL
MFRTPLIRTAVPVIVILVSTTTPVTAQEVRWRHDYSAARREATETGRPLLLDFGTEACVWCRKLDATTFRDPKVVKLLNEQFIAVKIDANREPKLTAALGVDSFPTLVLASASGKVIDRHVGYADVSQLTSLLSKAPAPVRPAAVATATGGPSAEAAKGSKERLDADLAALHREIAARLDQ